MSTCTDQGRPVCGPAYLLKGTTGHGLPPSPFGLIEELLSDDPWKMLLGCIMLNQTTRSQASLCQCTHTTCTRLRVDLSSGTLSVACCCSRCNWFSYRVGSLHVVRRLWKVSGIGVFRIRANIARVPWYIFDVGVLYLLTVLRTTHFSREVAPSATLANVKVLYRTVVLNRLPTLCRTRPADGSGHCALPGEIPGCHFDRGS